MINGKGKVSKEQVFNKSSNNKNWLIDKKSGCVDTQVPIFLYDTGLKFKQKFEHMQSNGIKT